MDDQTEIWLPVPGYGGLYELSNKHRVRSLGRTIEHGRDGLKRVIAPKLLKTSQNNGYLVAYLCPPERKGRGKMFYVEAAVAQLFPSAGPSLLDMSTGEAWRDIAGYEGYQISSFGRVRSLDRLVNTANAPKRWSRGVILSIGIGSTDYPKVELSSDGKVKTLMIHRLVAEAFIPNPLNVEVVHHKDEDRSNYSISNLEWVSAKTNISDWFDRRRIVVSVEMIKFITDAHDAGKTAAEILALLPQRKKKGR